MTKKGIGIIGYGGFAERLREAWASLDSVEVIAACDSNPDRAPHDLKFYSEVGALCADPEIDIVVIATPPNSHRDLAVMALQSGKHVLVEKPLALSETDARQIKEVAERNGLVASVDFMLRYNPVVEMLDKVIRSEVLGKLRRVDLRNYAMLDQTPEDHWFWNPEISGRIFLEHGVHFFNLAHAFIGSKAADVLAMSVYRQPGIEDEMFATVKYENDIMGTFWHSFSRPRVLETTTFHFAFDLGEADMFGWIPLELNIWGWTNKQGLDVLRGLSDTGDVQASPMEPMNVQSSKLFYDVDHDIRAKYQLGRPKMTVYAENLRSIMSDMVKAIDDPSHRMRVTLDDGIESVRVAEWATKFIHPDTQPATAAEAPEILHPQSR